MMNILKEHLKRHVTLSAEELDTICDYFEPRHVEKGDFLLSQGNICRYEGFVLEGCFRVYSLDDKGNENVLYFAVQDWWLIDIDSFMNAIPSDLNFQALENSEVLLISKSSKETLYRQLPIVERLFRIMSQKALVAWQRRLIRNHTLTAKERYNHFIQTYSDISSKLTDRQIASYLGITHEFLSKIKKTTLIDN